MLIVSLSISLPFQALLIATMMMDPSYIYDAAVPRVGIGKKEKGERGMQVLSVS